MAVRLTSTLDNGTVTCSRPRYDEPESFVTGDGGLHRMIVDMHARVKWMKIPLLSTSRVSDERRKIR